MIKENTHYNRRDFLKLLSVAGTMLPITKAISSPPAKTKIAVFSKPLEWLDYTTLAQTAAETGFDGLDLTVRPKGHVLPERVTEDLSRAVEAARKAGLEVTMLTTAITSARDKFTEPILKTASQLGIRYYRTGYLDYDESLGIEKSLERHKKQLAELAQLNKAYQIHGAYQNHSGTRVGGPVWDIWILLKDLDPSWIGCQYDIHHAVIEGGTAWPVGLKLLHKYIKTIDIKDFKWVEKEGKWREETVPLEEGMVDFKKYFELVNKLGIQAPVSLHYEYPFFPESANTQPLEARRKKAVEVMKKDLVKLRSRLKEAGLS
jgi:sugar phosphate isomerase/epimerase